VASVEKPAGSGGTYTYTLTVAPASAPTRTIFSDAGRTTVAAAATVMTATGSAVQFTGTYPLTLVAGRYFLRHTFSTVGGAALVDDDDDLLLVNPGGTVGRFPFTSDPASVAGRWRPLTAAELTLATQLLKDAEAIITARLPTLAARVTAGTLTSSLIEAVQVAMVLRVMQNPEGKRQESIDDYSWTRDNAVSSGLLYLGEDELARLLPGRVRARSVILLTHSSDR